MRSRGVTLAAMDLTGQSYWDRIWADTPTPDLGLGDYRDRRLAELFGQTVHGHVLEVGCANSTWLPYLARQGHPVTGLDYSPGGCEVARQLLERAGVEGEIVCGDLFQADSLAGRFDTVLSLGVVEHFTDTADAVRALARFLRPGGTLLTVIPNRRGTPGVLQRRLNRPVYDMHIPLTAGDLAATYRAAGLVDVTARNFMATGYGAINAPGRLQRNLSRASKLVWRFEERVRPLPASRWFSPYVVAYGSLPA
jgi:2-polyprenyl-3-methyl-5-hydroxy-6-metoxy-1,4-benzoquinol methylase